MANRGGLGLFSGYHTQVPIYLPAELPVKEPMSFDLRRGICSDP
jgi:hypothetical protein